MRGIYTHKFMPQRWPKHRSARPLAKNLRLEIKEEIKRKSSNAESIVRIYFFYTSSKAYLLHHQFDELKELDGFALFCLWIKYEF